jgi:hypothetical protein
VTRKFSGGGALALLFINLVFLFTVFPQKILYANSSQEKTVTQDAQSVQNKTPVRREPAEKPEWVHTVPQSNTEFFFVGTSQPYDTAANARDNARESARNQVLKFSGEFIESRAIARAGVSGSTRETLEGYINREDVFQSFAQNIVSEVSTTRYYTEVYLNSSNREEYVVYVLCQIGRQKAEDEIANFAKNISQRYAAMLPAGNTLKGTLEGYSIVARALEQNPLHGMTAYYDTPSGRVGLYGYVISRINDFANSVNIVSLPNRTVRRTDNLDTLVKLQSSQIPIIGPFDCRVSIQGMNSKIPVVNYTVTNDNSFLLSIFTNQFEPGRYNVQIEILLNEVTGNIAKNIGGGFSFEVTPLNAVLGNMAEIEDGLKKAVDMLAAGLQAQTGTRIGPFALTGTDVPSGLSRYLTERITHFAINNQERKFRVIRENGADANAVVLNGFFTRRGSQVDVTLEIIAPNGDINGSQAFSMSVAALNEREIAIEPENIAALNEREKIIAPVIANTANVNAPNVNQANQSINIQAFFNSESRTYLHRDELKITLMADKNCYFKIIHIDANNQMKMIYPNSYDENNYLRANMPRAIFETANYMLYGPYGAETILIVASAQPFANIEKEYITPWIPATAESVRTAVRGARGGELEQRTTPQALTGGGEARYTITILKPHEEYEYTRPSDMTAAVQAMRNDALRQGGTFDGNETSGFYILNNVRGSYRLPRNAPDKIQFAFYNLESFSDGKNAVVRTRGAGYNFSFEKPVNITQTIRTVRSGIEGKGGTFTGNEQQGSFKASGITGQYLITELVNVTITDKPVIVPNSLIEREVKNYFGGR